MTQKRTVTFLGILTVLVLALTAGCTPPPQYGDKAEDWKKSTPPPGWRGPGQPGGPPAGALNGPGSPPPAGAQAPR